MSLPVVVWLVGPGDINVRADAHVTRDRTAAWHLARGGCPAIKLDIQSSDPAGLYAETVTMRVLRPVWDERDTVTVMDWREVSDHSYPRPRPLDVTVVEAELERLIWSLTGRDSPAPGEVGLEAVQGAAQALRDAQAGRDAAIVATVDAGVPIARVARAAGLTRQTVYSIAHGWTRPDRRR